MIYSLRIENKLWSLDWHEIYVSHYCLHTQLHTVISSATQQQNG